MENYHSNYDGFTENMFAENEYFRQWVLHPDKDTTQYWSNYLKINPGQQQTILNAREKVKVSFTQDTMTPLTSKEKLILKNEIFQQIGHPIKSSRTLRRKGLQLLSYAAMASAIIIVPLYLTNKQPAAETIIVARTGMKEIKEISLPDSSIIILNANSSVTYNPKIGNIPERVITLEGNAYFKVKKKTDQRPFTVHTSSLSVSVLGTEFNVNARSKATAVVLTAGKVRLSLNATGSTTMHMSPGEKVQLDTLTNAFIKFRTNTLLYSAWTDGKWNFSSTSLLDITNLIHEYYGIETVYSSEKAKKLKISAVIPVTDLGSFINILAKTLDLKISEYQNQLHIQF